MIPTTVGYFWATPIGGVEADKQLVRTQRVPMWDRHTVSPQLEVIAFGNPRINSVNDFTNWKPYEPEPWIPDKPGYYKATPVPFEVGDPKVVVRVMDGYAPKQQSNNLVVQAFGKEEVYSLDDFTDWEFFKGE